MKRFEIRSVWSTKQVSLSGLAFRFYGPLLVLKEGVICGRNKESSFGDMDNCVYLYYLCFFNQKTTIWEH